MSWLKLIRKLEKKIMGTKQKKNSIKLKYSKHKSNIRRTANNVKQKVSYHKQHQI